MLNILIPYIAVPVQNTPVIYNSPIINKDCYWSVILPTYNITNNDFEDYRDLL